MAWADNVSARLPLRATALSEDTSASLADLLSALLVYRASLSDENFPSDTASALMRSLAAASDSFSPSDTLEARLNLIAILTEASGYVADLLVATLTSGAVPINVNVSDDVAAIIADSASALMRQLGAASDAVTLIDDLSAITRQLAQASDATGLTDNLSALLKILANLSEALGVAETLAITLTVPGVTPINVSIGDDVSTVLSDAVSLLKRLLARPSDAIEWDLLDVETLEVIRSFDQVAGKFLLLAGISDAVILADLVAISKTGALPRAGVPHLVPQPIRHHNKDLYTLVSEYEYMEE